MVIQSPHHLLPSPDSSNELSGIIVLIYKRFSYTKRSTWNELYRIDLQRLLTELQVAETLMVAEKYTALQEKKEREWATKNFEF